MLKILVTDDEARIRDIIKQYVEFEGFECIEAENGQQAVDICNEQDVDLIIMDIMMPVLDGLSALRIIRESKDTPVIMLSAKGEEHDKIFGLDLGSDDYIVKPFSPKELMARIRAIMKRRQSNKIESNTVEDKGIVIDKNAHRVLVDGNEIQITPKEFELLLLFVVNKGIVFSREKLLNDVWGYDFYGGTRTVDTHVKMLRNSLGDNHRNLIKTVWGVGYKYEET